jgi:hypothetical protein
MEERRDALTKLEIAEARIRELELALDPHTGPQLRTILGAVQDIQDLVRGLAQIPETSKPAPDHKK